jgi:D-beta-D-heptose 7-phosphate kinase/D-beta-D-heptose 1-phosphate adenosyltransferase
MQRSASHPTITKTRVIGGHQQMLRLDREESGAYLPADLDALLANACRLIDAHKPAVLLLSDYAKGALPLDLCQALIAKARSAGVAVLVDPKGRDFGKYRGATGITPNKHEAAMVCGVSVGDTQALLVSMAGLQRDLGLDFVALTRGSEGISLLDAEGEQLFPAEARQVFDVSGAGDTVIGTLAAAMAAGLAPRRACALANVAASVVVGKVGTVPIQHAELLQALEQQNALDQAHKFMDLETLAQQVEAWRKQGLRIIFTNGCFDLLHVGHVTYLGQARRLGDRLVVGLNTDRSVRSLKGATRPVINETDRAHVLCALEAVSAVTLFDDDTPLALIQRLRPDVLVKGSDYSEEQVVGAAEVRAWGGKVALIPVVPGRSSSQIIDTLGGCQDGDSLAPSTA